VTLPLLDFLSLIVISAFFIVIPAKAGIHTLVQHREEPVTDTDPGLLASIRNALSIVWIPAFAGMTTEGKTR
jgi:hypothetical protein